jgi:hypothetical protein
MANRYYRHEYRGAINVIYIPDDWPVDEDGDFLGYGPGTMVSNDPDVRTLWFSSSYFTHEISEEEARAIHPALFAYLETL